MKKIVRLTESDLTRLIKRVINEMEGLPGTTQSLGTQTPASHKIQPSSLGYYNYLTDKNNYFDDPACKLGNLISADGTPQDQSLQPMGPMTSSNNRLYLVQDINMGCIGKIKNMYAKDQNGKKYISIEFGRVPKLPAPSR